ncbi:MAG: DUF86 domain-containing protein [Methanoregula sp.]|nr:DUF86 domain-containing protein [Methanoregula sp.]
MGSEPAYDEERIGTIILDIRTYIRDLADLKIENIRALHDKRNFYATSMLFFSLLNRVFDLGSEVAMANDLGIPSTYREIFLVLNNNGFIDSALAEEMVRLVTYRNLLSHEYHGITEEKLFNLTCQIGTIEEFVRQMQEKIREER